MSSVDNLILVKNSAGEIYYPTYSINQIGNMNPGEAYQISVSQSETFTYPSTTSIIPSRNPVFTVNGPNVKSYFNTDVSQTGNSSVIVIEDSDLSVGEFAAITDDGLIVGVGEFIDGKAVFTIWGDNEITPEIDGAKAGDNISLRYYDQLS